MDANHRQTGIVLAQHWMSSRATTAGVATARRGEARAMKVARRENIV